MKNSKVQDIRPGSGKNSVESGCRSGRASSSPAPDDLRPAAAGLAAIAAPASGRNFFIRRYGLIILLFISSWICGGVLICARHRQQPSFLLLSLHKTQTIRAKYPFTYPDLAQARVQKAAAVRRQPLVFTLRDDRIREILEAFRLRLAALATTGKEATSSENPAERELRLILANDTAAAAFLRIVRETLLSGTRGEHHRLPNSEDAAASGDHRARIKSSDGVFERDYQTLLSLPSAQKAIEDNFSRSIGHPGLDLSIFWSDPAWQPTLDYEFEESLRLQEEARATVSVPLRKFAPGSVLLSLSPEEREILRAYESAHPSQGGGSSFRRNLAFERENILRVLLLGGLIAAFVFILCRVRFSPANLRQRLAVSAIALILHFLLVHFLLALYCRLGLPPEGLISFLPLALIPALMANLLGARTAICTALVIAIAVPLQVEVGVFQYQFFCLTLLTSLVGVGFFQAARQRRDFIVGGFGLGLAIACAGIVFCLDTRLAWADIQALLPNILIISYSNGLLMGILIMALLPVFEYFFELDTLSTLMELSDTNHPLLRRLQQEAPGTYQHSLNVASIAEAGAQAIRANAPLARAMALFHDIGKLGQPDYFAENFASESVNPHNSLSPQESAQILAGHVSTGLELANQHHLRRSLRAIIAQHHGTSLIGSFYQKACKQAKADGLPAPEESLFRYQYQLPRQKEIVIVSLADACEAAVKSLAGRRPDYQSLLRKAVSTVTPAIRQGNTNQQELLAACVSAVKDEATPALHPEAIMRKIAEIIDGKWLDRQFVEADISTAELEELKRSIQKTILEIHHFRPEYPDTDARRAAK